MKLREIYATGLILLLSCVASFKLQARMPTWMLNRHGTSSYLMAVLKEIETALPTPHHTALKVYNISRSMAFYSLFGWEEEARFRAGPARAVWLKFPEQGCVNHRLELIEVPLALEPAPKARDLSAASSIAITGLNHFTLDISAAARDSGGMRAYLQQLNARSEAWFNKSIRLVVDPYQQIIAQNVYEMAFVSDPDGVLVELIAFNVTLPQEIEAAW
jgi:catechol 2,3-dioxygenase-like lactoylglutathione lyase family enzyme